MLWDYKNEFFKGLRVWHFFLYFFIVFFIERALEPLSVITTLIIWLETSFYIWDQWINGNFILFHFYPLRLSLIRWNISLICVLFFIFIEWVSKWCSCNGFSTCRFEFLIAFQGLVHLWCAFACEFGCNSKIIVARS